MASTLLDILLITRRISESEASKLKEEFLKSGKQEEDFLLGKLSEDAVFDAKSRFYGVPLKNFSEDVSIDQSVLNNIPEEVSRNYKFIPFAMEGSTLHVAMVNPQDIRASDAIKFILTSKNLSAKIFLVTNSQFEKLFKQYSALGTKVKEALEEVDEVEKQRRELQKALAGESEELAKLAEEAPVNKIISVIFKHAYEGKASDIHIEPLEKETRVRFRIDGVLHASLKLPKEIHDSIVSKIKILSNLKIDETRVPQDGRFRTRINNSQIDFRVSTFPTVDGEKVVLRLLDLTTGLKSLDELGFIGYSAQVIDRALKKPFGMILTTGPTGSGKSTTLQSMLGVLNEEGVNIVSLEDPVEYYVSGVNQSQVKPEIDYTFASGLRSILRQDPNVIMVGEIRDSETAALAVHAALTGHIVLSTIHTNDAIGVLSRLIDMKVEPFLIPSALNLIIAQRLVKKLCSFCKKPVKPEGRVREILDENISKMPEFLQAELQKQELQIYQAPGCQKCANKGTLGRMVIFEVLEMTPELKSIIINQQVSEMIGGEMKRQNMITMRQDGIVKALKGYIPLEDVLQSTI
ncbi:type II/IV secretion system protein [Candidatus Azambacteria bacterium]|nr:type II/IV secretion system protein [Candidatus Azambacteria bacterium]